MYSTQDIVVVGAGISGLTLAEKYASAGKKVLVVEKRNHIGGNCYDYFDEHGVLVPKYGPHFFHTNYPEVWNYVNKFSRWVKYEHRVLSFVDGRLVPVPVNISTVNILFNLDMQCEDEMKAWLSKNVIFNGNPSNSEEACIGKCGVTIYEKLFKNYTIKQWDKHPSELSPSVLNRIPVRTSFDDRYFEDIYQGMPADGYTKVFAKMINHPNIEVKLNTDYYDIKDSLTAQKTFFTGPVDRYFEYKAGDHLQYRSVKFEHESFDVPYYQQLAQINYPNEYGYTRITEPKHATGQIHTSTTIIRDYPTWAGEGYYPVPDAKNSKLFSKYQSLVLEEVQKNVYFVGRLATYNYINMDQAFKLALDLFETLEADEV